MITITKSTDFFDIINNNNLVLIYCGLTKCEPCKKICPQFEAYYDENIKDKKDIICCKITINELDMRVEKFKNWIIKREEKTIAVICHGTFISRIIHFFLNNCEFEIWHLKNGK